MPRQCAATGQAVFHSGISRPSHQTEHDLQKRPSFLIRGSFAHPLLRTVFEGVQTMNVKKVILKGALGLGIFSTSLGLSNYATSLFRAPPTKYSIAECRDEERDARGFCSVQAVEKIWLQDDLQDLRNENDKRRQGEEGLMGVMAGAALIAAGIGATKKRRRPRHLNRGGGLNHRRHSLDAPATPRKPFNPLFILGWPASCIVFPVSLAAISSQNRFWESYSIPAADGERHSKPCRPLKNRMRRRKPISSFPSKAMKSPSARNPKPRTAGYATPMRKNSIPDTRG